MAKRKLDRMGAGVIQARIPNVIFKPFRELVATTMGSAQDHVTSAILLYMSLPDQLRTATHLALMRTLQANTLVLPDLETDLLTPAEKEFVDKFRAATPKAQREAVANLEDQPLVAPRKSRTGQTRNRRA